MKILISGSRGYVGSALTEYLRNKHITVYEINRYDDYNYTFQINEENYVVGRLKDFEALISDLKVSTLVNASACVSKKNNLNDLEDLLNANVMFSSRLSHLALNSGIKKYIFLTTYSTFVNPPNYSPQTLYAASKQAAEDILTFYHYLGLNIEFMHLYDIYGPNQQHPRFLNLLLKSIKTGENFKMSPGDQEINLINISDVCHAIYSRLNIIGFNSEPEHFSVFSNETIKLKQLPIIVSSAINEISFLPRITYNYEYRQREIFKFSPRYPLVPNWTNSISLLDGIRELWSSIESENT